MAAEDKKISELDPITSISSSDLFAIVDVSELGDVLPATRKVAISEVAYISVVASIEDGETLSAGRKFVDATDREVSLYLPAASSFVGPGIVLFRLDDSANDVTVSCEEIGKTINGESSIKINNQYGSLEFFTDKINWYCR
jgi:hypothetical protein